MCGKAARIMFTGASGYLGGRLTKLFAENGYEVIALGRADVAGLKTYHADFTDPAAVSAAFDEAMRDGKIDAVLHLAGANEIVCAREPEEAFRTTSFGTKHLVESAVAHAILRVIYISTIHVYGNKERISEETIPEPFHPYGITRLAAELFARAAVRGSKTTLAIARLSNGIGAPATAEIDRWTLVLLDLARQAHERGALTLATPGLQQRDFIAIDDIFRALTLLLTSPPDRLSETVFNVGSGTSTSIRDVAHAVQRAYQQLYHHELSLSFPMGDNSSVVSFSIERIRRLGFIPSTDLECEAAETLRFCERFRRKG